MEDNFTEIEMKLKTEKDFISYLHLLKEVKYNYIIFIAVADTAVGPDFPKKAADEFKKCLKLKTNLMNKFRVPYVAVIDHGKVFKEICSDESDKPIEIEDSLKNLDFYVFSRSYVSNNAQILGGRAIIKLNDKTYCDSNIRGIHFLVFDPNKNIVMDYCFFDGYSKLNCRKPYEVESDIITFVKAHPKVQLITFNFLKFPSNVAAFTDNEKFIINNNLTHTNFVKHVEEIYENKLSPLCEECDSLEDMKELVSTPKSYINVDGTLKFEDTTGNKVNILNGIRITTDQPSNPKRAIFIVGTCTIFCVGADDSHTLESYLQRRLNNEVADKGFIVFNYGFFLGSFWDNRRDKLINILNSIPAKDGDIIFLRYDAKLQNIPMLFISDKAERPHNHGELFYSKNHYTSNGYSIIADELYDYLHENNFFESTDFTHEDNTNEMLRGGGYRMFRLLILLIQMKYLFLKRINCN